MKKYFLCILLLSSTNLSVASSAEVVTFSRNDDTIYADAISLAIYNEKTKTYKAFDTRDSNFPELARAKDIYNELEKKYLEQALAIEKNTKANE